MMSFFLNMIPPTATFQQKTIRQGKKGEPARLVKTGKLRDAESRLKAHLMDAAKELSGAGKFHPVTEGAIKIAIEFIFPPRGKNSGRYMTKAPDLDNLAKTFIDELTLCGFIGNDKQIVYLQLGKSWADEIRKPGIGVTIQKFEVETE